VWRRLHILSPVQSLVLASVSAASIALPLAERPFAVYFARRIFEGDWKRRTMANTFRKLFMLVVVLLPSMGRAQDWVHYGIEVCNKGKISFVVATAERKVGAWVWSSPSDWRVEGWTNVAPYKCADVWKRQTWESGLTVNSPAVYLVFAFSDSTGVWGTAPLDFSKSIFSKRASNQQICVRQDDFGYDLPSGRLPTECKSGYYPNVGGSLV
jgi:hypothetical protein